MGDLGLLRASAEIQFVSIEIQRRICLSTYNSLLFLQPSDATLISTWLAHCMQQTREPSTAEFEALGKWCEW